MHWLRLYHDAAHDPKWRMIAVECGLPVATILGVWSYMLIFASQAEPRGVLVDWDDRIAGAALDLKAAQVAEIREAMQGVVLDGYELTGWEKRQREASDDAAERKRRSRAAKRSDTPPSGGGSHAPNGSGGYGNGDETLPSRDNGALSRDTAAMSRDRCVTASAREEYRLQKEEEEQRGSPVCELEPPACAPAREGDTHTGSRSPDRTGNVVALPAREVRVLPEGWVPSDGQRQRAIDLGHRDVDGAALRFREHWITKADNGERGAAKSAVAWADAWEWWVRQDVRNQAKGTGSHGKQHHAAPAKGANATAKLFAEIYSRGT